MLLTVLILAIGLTFLALILTIIWLLKVSGLFETIRINIAQPSFEELTILYKFHQADYSTSADTFRDILNYSPSHSTLGIYYDNPDETQAEQRRFIVGIIVDETKDQEIIDKMKTDGYKAFRLPKSVRSVYTTFPFHSVFSIFIAIKRVYPRLNEYVKTNKLNAYPIIEVYEPTLIHYFLPLSNHETYFVPEVVSKLEKTD